MAEPIGTPPYDRDTERSLLATLLRYPEHADQILSILPTERVFFFPIHCAVFHAMRDARKQLQLPDPVVVLAHLRNRSDGIEITAAHIGDIEQAGGSPKNIVAYAGIVKALWYRREAISVATQIHEASNTEAPEALASLFRLAATSLEQGTVGLPRLDLAAALRGELPEIPWLVEGWLARGDRATLAGEWATGKSVIALDLAIAVASGLPWLGRFSVARTGPVLYVDEENNPVNASRRFARFANGRNVTPSKALEWPITYIAGARIRLDSSRSLGLLRGELDATRPVLVVFDSLVRFVSGDENKSGKIAELYDQAIKPIADDYGCAVLVLDHMSKPNEENKNEDSGHRIRGSGDKAGAADVVWTLQGDRESDSRTLSCRKNRWEDSLPAPVTTRFHVSEDETACWLIATDAQLAATEAIEHALTDAQPEGMHATELYERCQALGVIRITAIRAAKRLVKQDVISCRKEGRKIRYWVGQLDPKVK